MTNYFEEFKKLNIINNHSDIIVNSNYGKMINFSEINRKLFGRRKCPDTVCLQELIDEKIVFQENKKPYLICDKISTYFEKVGDLENQSSNYILITYYSLINKDLSNFNEDINQWWNGFKDYIKTRKKHNKVVLGYIGDDVFNGELEEYNSLLQLYTIKFTFQDNIFNISFGYSNLKHDYYSNIKNPNFKELYNKIVYDTLLKTPRDFVIHNLTRVTGSKPFATLLFDSHNNKSDHVIPIQVLDDIIQFKSHKLRNDYVQYFISKYNDIYTLKEDGIYLNFIGLNKYFLNLEEKYLSSFEMKDCINDFYTNITNELIDSYKVLYKSVSI